MVFPAALKLGVIVTLAPKHPSMEGLGLSIPNLISISSLCNWLSVKSNVHIYALPTSTFSSLL